MSKIRQYNKLWVAKKMVTQPWVSLHGYIYPGKIYHRYFTLCDFFRSFPLKSFGLFFLSDTNSVCSKLSFTPAQKLYTGMPVTPVTNSIVQCTLCTVHCKMCNVQCQICTVHYTMCTVQCKLCTVQCKLWTVRVNYSRFRVPTDRWVKLT